MLKKTFSKNIKQNFGIGIGRISNIIKYCGLNSRLTLKNIKKKHLEEIDNMKSNMILEKKLKNNIKNNINFLVENRSYKGIRHKLRHPVRGQRTRTNAQTSKKKFL